MRNLRLTGSRYLTRAVVSGLLTQSLGGCAESDRAPRGRPLPSSTPSAANAEPAVGDAVAAPAGEMTAGGQLALSEAIEALKVKIAKRAPTLEGERDRAGRLSSELLSDSSKGCWANVRIAKLELRVKGSWLDRKLVNGETKTPQTGTGNPQTVNFQLGDSIGLNIDERTNSLFQPAGKLVTADFRDYKVSDIEFIRLNKSGVGYDNERVCKLILGFESCRYQVYEENRYQLDSLELWVNDSLLYKRDGIGKILENGNLDWSETNLSASEAWAKLMAREDCAQQQIAAGDAKP